MSGQPVEQNRRKPDRLLAIAELPKLYYHTHWYLSTLNAWERRILFVSDPSR